MVDQTQRLSRYRELIQELNETKKMEIARRTVELFFSFDIVNSSLYKTINYTGWYNVIISLFKEIQASVMKLMPGAEMWRVLGDEIVFIIPIKENKDFFVYTDKIFEILNIFVLKLKNGQFFDELEIDNDKKLLMKMQNVISLKAADKGKCKEETGVIKENDNLLFYEDIAKYSKESYLIALYKKYQDTVKTEDELLKREIDYADEITYNAKIIVQKYKCFKNARYVDFIGLVGIAVLILAA